jgi:hypothetical protein
MFVIYTGHLVLFGWRSVQVTCVKNGLHTELWWGNVLEGVHLEDDEGGKITLRWIPVK